MKSAFLLRSKIVQGLLFAFLVNSLGIQVVYAQEFVLPKPGQVLSLSSFYNPPILKGLKVHPENPFKFDFILDVGDGFSVHKDDEAPLLRNESLKLIKYFLASLTIPEKDLWVNLSPYEKNRIVPEAFGKTEMGRDLLAEDYILKQITASLMYPEGEIGKKFWKRINEEALKKFGTTNVPVNTFNKVWIVPDKAVVYENAKAGTAYVVESKLRVMLEEDYLSTQKHEGQPGERQPGDMFKSELQRTCPHAGCQASELLSVKAPQVNPRTPNDQNSQSQSIRDLGSQIIREIIIPDLTKEVNEGSSFAQLRQVYNSLILAIWYKKKIKNSILGQVYENKSNISGITSSRNALIGNPDQIFQRYIQAFKKGTYSYIREETDPITQQLIPRKYFSGGADLLATASIIIPAVNAPQGHKGLYTFSMNFVNASMGVDKFDRIGKRITSLDLNIVIARLKDDASAFENRIDFPDTYVQDARVNTFAERGIGDDLIAISLATALKHIIENAVDAQKTGNIRIKIITTGLTAGISIANDNGGDREFLALRRKAEQVRHSIRKVAYGTYRVIMNPMGIETSYPIIADDEFEKLRGEKLLWVEGLTTKSKEQEARQLGQIRFGGRGMGLNELRKEIQELNGRVSVVATNEETMFNIMFPKTMLSKPPIHPSAGSQAMASERELGMRDYIEKCWNMPAKEHGVKWFPGMTYGTFLTHILPNVINSAIKFPDKKYRDIALDVRRRFIDTAVSQLEFPPDPAQVNTSIDAPQKYKNGGIDLSSDQALSFQNNGQSIQFRLDPALLAQWRENTRVMFSLSNIIPLNDLHSFLGGKVSARLLSGQSVR